MLLGDHVAVTFGKEVRRQAFSTLAAIGLPEVLPWIERALSAAPAAAW